jgi:LPXTG-motif cell wall-anchored protein
VAVFLFAGKGNGDENTELFDFAPEGDPVAGPGDHTLTVDLPNCSEFIVDFIAFPPPEVEPGGGAEVLSRARTDAARVMAEGDQPPDDSLLDEVIGETTNCPTETTNAEVAAPTTITTEGSGGLPRTGTNAMPMLIAGLVLVAGGAAAVLGSRLRGRATK